ncbi:fatty acid-2 hydroxylase [Meredithblackwellia eburnea MCA 4105]
MGTTPRSRSKIYLAVDVAKHNKPNDCFVVYDGKVFDVTKFVVDHPGGDDLILNYAGRDVTEIMADPVEHSHSDSAYELLRDFQVGVVGTEETITNPDFEYTDSFEPEDTAVEDDYKKNQFLDLSRPLIMQVWNSNFSKGFYLQQVHQPRHLPHPARLFGPWYLEMFTVTPWYMVPLIWLPITFYLVYRSLVDQSLDVGWSMRLTRTGICFALGNLIWTLLEYGMHRFLFHMDEKLPDHRIAITLHFLLHGIHHYIPMDRLRLVMPPLLFTVLETPFTQLAHTIFPGWMANGIISGAFFFYVGYDTIHYALHHSRLTGYIRSVKSHHMQHHYKEPDMGFGVTSPIWDWVFGTQFVQRPSAGGKTA